MGHGANYAIGTVIGCLNRKFAQRPSHTVLPKVLRRELRALSTCLFLFVRKSGISFFARTNPPRIYDQLIESDRFLICLNGDGDSMFMAGFWELDLLVVVISVILVGKRPFCSHSQFGPNYLERAVGIQDYVNNALYKYKPVVP
jgi:hypothetical protein